LEYPRATTIAGEPSQGKETLRIEGIQVHPGSRLNPQEESTALDVAFEHTDLSSRQSAAWITDNKGFSVSESSVYRIHNGQGLIKSPEMKMAVGK